MGNREIFGKFPYFRLRFLFEFLFGREMNFRTKNTNTQKIETKCNILAQKFAYVKFYHYICGSKQMIEINELGM